MRERTPSADDTPKRAPPAPPREAASADVAGSKTSSESLDVSQVSKFPAATTASSAATATASSPSPVDARMVASQHNLDDLAVSAGGDRQQQQQEKHVYAYRSGQTAQDKRSRLSNVINNLRKKVPDSRNGDSPRKEEDDRNSVERNLETLEKYVMTVLNGVIKDEEEEEEEEEEDGKNQTETGKEQEKLAADQEDEDSKGPAAKFEPSKPNESRTEAAVFPSEATDKPEPRESRLEHQGRTENSVGGDESRGCKADRAGEEAEGPIVVAETAEEVGEVGERDETVQGTVRNDGQENRSLGTIIMERLSENQSDERQDCREFGTDNAELRNVCRDLLNDLLNGINQLIDENSQQKDDVKAVVEHTSEESRESRESREPRGQEFSMTSLHCSLPLDKVASVLQNCQTSEPAVNSSSPSTSQGPKSPCKPPSPTVRHCLCLYCDRKFMSISLRQRHTERVHQQGGGRRPERNPRKSSQNCQYCSDKCGESLEGLFQHMVGSHGDKYYGCLQCSTRYLTREALASHTTENHGHVAERNLQIQEKSKEPSPCKEPGSQSPPRPEAPSPKERRSDDTDHEHRTEPILLKPMLPVKDNISNPGSPEFDSSFYSSVSCNIRENLLHHLDGKLQSSSATVASPTSSAIDAKPQQQQQQQSFYEHSVNQIQLPIDISLTAATPVYSKEYSSKGYENNSEYAQKPGKSNRSHPRRVSFEKYNFPRKYDGKEQWTCSIKDLSNFDISTQLSLRKKQQSLKERLGLNRLPRHHTPCVATEIVREQPSIGSRIMDESGSGDEGVSTGKNDRETEQVVPCEASRMADDETNGTEAKAGPVSTEFSLEFGSFLRLRKWDEKTSVEAARKQEIVYAELTGEWCRPRVYICGACASKHVTLRDMEDHKVTSHPNVWCSHFEFSGDQRELYKHLFLPGKDVPTAKARSAVLAEKVCTKCSKNYNTLPELHRHMLECGGDQAWLLGLFGNGKKKCKWRPFGSRSRRRRQRGMKRNIQNSQTPRMTTPKEKQPAGPRVRPSDRESIQKMLANLPPKRATRKVLQDSSLRTQGRLRNVQTRTRPRMVGENSSASRMSRNKAALRNKLLKNAKSIQRNRCRIDNISAVIESVVRNYAPDERRSDEEKKRDGDRIGHEKETKEKSAERSSLAKEDGTPDDKWTRTKLARGPRVLGKKRNVKTKEGSVKTLDQPRRAGHLKAKARSAPKDLSEARTDIADETARTLKSLKVSPKVVEKESDLDGTETSPGDARSPGQSMKNKSSVQTTPKRKRPVDPVASLNASIKAKSQLRTQDGKFARNPNKESPSPQKSSPEMRSPVSDRGLARAKNAEAGPELSVTRSKFRALSRGKNGEQLPKRTTRLSSDSDKMPTLEPAVQASTIGDEYPEVSGNDLPILSPATPASVTEKILRGKGPPGKCSNLDAKDGSRKTAECEPASDPPAEYRDQKPGKGRRPRNEVRNLEKCLDSVAVGADKEKCKRRSAPARMLATDEKRGAARNPMDAGSRKKLETRSNSKARMHSAADEECPMKIQNVPFEVKKLIGSGSNEDLLTKLVLASRVAASKRCLRQPAAKARPELGEIKSRPDPEKAMLDSGSTSDASTRKEKFDARRKSLRNSDRKDKVAARDDNVASEDGGDIRDAANEGKTAVRGRRSSSLSGDSRVPSSDGQGKSDVEAATKNGDKRQTRGSLINSSEGEVQSEVGDASSKRNTVGRRRGRVKTVPDNFDKRNIDVSQVKCGEPVDKDSSVEQSELIGERGELNIAKDKLDEGKRDRSKVPGGTEIGVTGKTSVNHSRVETGNSIDSGKENSLEAPAPVQKLKVGRPRKSWGPKKERATKRSLNSVIGILTEGMNIPVETQQSVLNVQTSVDGSSAVEFLQDNVQTLETGSCRLDGGVSQVTNDSDHSTEGAIRRQNDSEESSSTIEAPEVSARNEPASKEPANDIILDLSRRKQKGKGSFLEKIVSKIAKQKDALLEGEVGSLLDTAADELTSILDEVGPSFPEGNEASSKAGSGKRSRQESTNEGCADACSVSNNRDQNLETSDTKLDTERRKIPSKEEDPTDRVENRTKNSEAEETKEETVTKPSDEETNDSPIEIKSMDEIQRTEGTRFEASTNESKTVQVEVFAVEAAVGSTEVPVQDSRREECARTKRKYKRRSLDGGSSKKNKRRPTEPADNSRGNQSADELHLSDILDLIEKSKQVPSTTEHIENVLSDVDVSPSEIQSGERRSAAGAPDTTDASACKTVDNARTADDTDENIEKFEADAERKSEANGRTSDVEINDRGVGNSVRDFSDQKSSPSPRTTGKRKSCVEQPDRYSRVESPVRRSSKRRSFQEEKANRQLSEEETTRRAESAETKESSSCEATSDDVGGTRRRSSRTKCAARSKNEDRFQEDSENSVQNLSNVHAAEDSESSAKDPSEDSGSSKGESPRAQTILLSTADGSKVAEEDSKLKIVETEGETVQNAAASEAMEPEKTEEPAVVPKVPKKRGRKKKCLIADQTLAQGTATQANPYSRTEIQASGLDTATQLPPRRSTRASRSNEESEDRTKHSTDPQAAPSSLEHFKVPEVTEVLQHTKKRTYKRRSVVEEHSDAQNSCPTMEAETSGADNSDVARNQTENVEQAEHSSRNDPSEGRGTAKEQLDLQRSSSSGSIDLSRTARTRSSKRRQLSSEDLPGQEALNRRAESVDNLSETSCVSESSYFRKKRFSKKKKEFQPAPEEVQTDTSVTDSESVDAEKTVERRQSLKRRAKKNISFLEDLLFLVDGFDIPMDIQDCISQEDGTPRAEPGPTAVDDNGATVAPTEAPSQVSQVDAPVEDEEQPEAPEDTSKLIAEEEEEEEEEEDEEDEEEEKPDDKVDGLSPTQDGFQTPKKRAAGNYVVVHKKTGEILIVEKRKKLTKEAAKFFCDVCATSFTRKSSLKKHNQSQSHLIQMGKCKKGLASVDGNGVADDACNASQNDVSSDENPIDEAASVPAASRDARNESEPSATVGRDNVDLVREDPRYSSMMEPSSLIDPRTSQQHAFEDELLDEEICKITENMSHDEYVLTDHVSPEPESTSTPVKLVAGTAEEAERKNAKEKAGKRILDDEGIASDSFELETAALVSVPGENTSMKIGTSARLNVSDGNSKAANAIEADDLSLEQVGDISTPRDPQNGCPDRVAGLRVERNDADANIAERDTVFGSGDNVYQLNAEEKTENFLTNSLEDTNERSSLKFTVNKHRDEPASSSSPDVNYSSTLINDPAMISVESHSKAFNQDVNDSEVETDRLSLDSSSFKAPETGRVKGVENIEAPDASELRRIVEDGAKLLDDSIDRAVAVSKAENEKASESAKTSRHGKSKRGRARKQIEDTGNNSCDKIGKAPSKSKDAPDKLLSDGLARIPEPAGDQKSIDDSDRSGSPSNASHLENNSCSINSTAGTGNFDNEIDPDGLRIVEEQDTSVAFGLKQVSVGNIELLNSKLKPFHSADDEVSSSSSLADKPLSQVLLEQMRERESFTGSPRDPNEEPKSDVEEIGPKTDLRVDIDENSLAGDELIDNQKSDEQTELRIASEGEREPDQLRTTGRILSESVNVETTRATKTISNSREPCETKGGNRKSSGKRSTRPRRHSKDNRRRSRGRGASVRCKIADLISESDDSENEGVTESQNKNKIVKSVFGRVFGGEKADKVKEVLNDWVSKSEDDSETSRTELGLSSENGSRTKVSTEEKSTKRHPVSSSISASPKKRPGKRSKKGSSSDRSRERARSKHVTNNRRKHEEETSNGYFQALPSTRCRPSKKRAEELISRTFENDVFEAIADKGQKPSRHKEGGAVSRSQDKPDLTVKDSGYGSFNYDEDSSKVAPLDDPPEDEQRSTKRRKSSSSRKSKCKTDDEDWSDLILDKKLPKDSDESADQGDRFAKDLPEKEPPASRLSIDPESSRSCSSLAPSSVRNRSPSMDRNSQTTGDSDAGADGNEGMEHRRISPLFIRGTPRSSIESSTNSENEEDDDNAPANEVATRKRSSSEFSGEKIVIRSPSSAHKGEVVTIAPTDAVEDNALDVPQDIEATKPRQGKVLNFDEELFVECCSRLKATTENELRGAKKIKLDHSENYHRKDEQQQGFRGPRDRWRDVESQNSLGSLLESVNQLLGEEMYSTRERDYPKRGGRNLRSEHSSRSASPDMSRHDNLGYEDSLDVAFEHNNKLRDKIQQRMRESENLIASTFGQKSGNEKNNRRDVSGNSYSYMNDQRHLSAANLPNGEYNDPLHVRGPQEQQNSGKIHLHPAGLKGKMNTSLGGLLDKALSNLLHNNEKHDHNGSTPMKVLAELACARAPTSTAGDSSSHEAAQPLKNSAVNRDSLPEPSPATMPKELQKKPRNPIKELFERKKEMNDRKQQEKSKTEAALRELNVHRQRKTKRAKKHQEFPLIRRNELGGLVERKKRRDCLERKEEFGPDRIIKDVYEFDEEESQTESNLGGVMSYRSRPGYEVSCLKTKEVDVAGLMSKAIGDSLENGKAGDALSTRLESMIDRKFKELEKFAPKTKGALKAFQGEDQQRQVTGPMDEFVERKTAKPKKMLEPVLKHSKMKKRSKNSKKKTRNAWYENDSSDEYRTAIKTDDVGVGISKSQRTCSKGKQNIFAELYTSSESEYEEEGADYESRRQRRVKKTAKKAAELESVEQSQEFVDKYSSGNEDRMDDWRRQDLKGDGAKHDSDNKKSESEMSDHPLVIDERKDADEQRNSDEETENQYGRNFEMDDLYREDSSIVDSDAEDQASAEQPKVPEVAETRSSSLPGEKADSKADYMQENELIPLEEALDLLDQADSETPLDTNYTNRNIEPVHHVDTVVRTEREEDVCAPVEEPVVAEAPTPAEEQEEEPDNDLLALPEKLSSNEKPQKESENLPLHVFLSRKVQESKKRKEQQLKKMQEEQERILMDFQPTRRQRKCAIGKQGLLAEISSSDEELSPRDRKFSDKSDHEKQRKQKRESKEKRKERYIEKKHEQMIAKEQKAIEEEILRELGKKKESQAQNTADARTESNGTNDAAESAESVSSKATQEPLPKKKHQTKEKQKKQSKPEEDVCPKNSQREHSDLENSCAKSATEEGQEAPARQKKHSRSPAKNRKPPKTEAKVAGAGKRNRNSNVDKKNKTDSRGSKDKERRSSSGRRDSDDEELKTTKSWNKVEEGVGVAIGRRKRSAANQLYYWSSSSDEEELLEVVPAVEEEEDDRQEQHGWIVGDSHKRMITMLAMEKQLKEKRRRSEDEFEAGKAKSKKHRNSTS